MIATAESFRHFLKSKNYSSCGMGYLWVHSYNKFSIFHSFLIFSFINIGDFGIQIFLIKNI